jgi:hypothetical protein
LNEPVAKPGADLVCRGQFAREGVNESRGLGIGFDVERLGDGLFGHAAFLGEVFLGEVAGMCVSFGIMKGVWDWRRDVLFALVVCHVCGCLMGVLNERFVVRLGKFWESKRPRRVIFKRLLDIAFVASGSKNCRSGVLSIF